MSRTNLLAFLALACLATTGCFDGARQQALAARAMAAEAQARAQAEEARAMALQAELQAKTAAAVAKTSEAEATDELAVAQNEALAERRRADSAEAELRKLKGDVSPAKVERTFDGEWFSPEFKYAFKVSGNEGVVTLSNSDKLVEGEVMLKIEAVVDGAFLGRQLFTEGHWVRVMGVLPRDKELEMSGGGFSWKMTPRE